MFRTSPRKAGSKRGMLEEDLDEGGDGDADRHRIDLGAEALDDAPLAKLASVVR
jgi:hypothetical protein